MRPPRVSLRRLASSEALSIAFALHVIGLILTDSVKQPLAVALLALVMVITRVVLGVLAQGQLNSRSWLLARGIVTLLFVGTIIIADGGTESPFFFWLLLVIAWQAVTFSMVEFRVAVVVATAVYVTVVLVAGDVTATSIARFGLFLAFLLVMGLGRFFLESYESRVRRLEHTLAAVLSISAMGIVVYDSDRQTPLFTNEAAIAMGLATHAGMARLVPDGSFDHVKIDTLASLVEDAGWLPYEPRMFRVVGEPSRMLRIGVHALRLEDAEPVILVYGEAVEDQSAGPRRSP